MLLARFVLAETPKVPSVRFDVFSAATLAATSGGALFALNRGGEWAPATRPVLVALVVAVAAGVAFVRSQRRRADPLLPLDELTRRPFGAPVRRRLLRPGGDHGSFTLVPLLLREQLAYSVAGSVFVLLPLPIGMATMAPLGGRLSTSIGERWTATLGGVSLVLGCALLAFGAHLESAAVIAGAFALVGAANGLGRPALVTSAANALRHSYMGVGVAITRMVSQLGAATGITTLVVVRGTNGFTTAFLVALPFAALALLTASRVVSSAAEPVPVADPLGVAGGGGRLGGGARPPLKSAQGATGFVLADAVEGDRRVGLGQLVDRVATAGLVPAHRHPDGVAHEQVHELGVEVGPEHAGVDAPLEHRGPQPLDLGVALLEVGEPLELLEIARPVLRHRQRRPVGQAGRRRPGGSA